jgi:hypothetical protein
MSSTTSPQPLVLRVADATDAAALQQLAELDSARLGAGPHLVAEVEGRIVAAVSLTDRSVIADPFAPTAGLVAVLLAKAATEPGAAQRSGLRERLRAVRRQARVAHPTVPAV